MTKTHKIILLILAVLAVGYVLVDNSQRPPILSTGDTDGYSLGVGGESMMFAQDSIMPTAEVARDETSQYYAPPFEPTAGKTAIEVDQKIIKSGYITLLVDSALDAVPMVNMIAEKYSGFTQNSNAGELPNGNKFGSVTIRVPAESYDSALADIRALGIKTVDESSNAQDVTEQYTDLEARLGVAQNEEQAYLQLLARAGSVGDLLQVQRELSNVRSQIESLQGQIQYLQNQTSLSTITVSLQEEASISVPTKPFRFISTVKSAFNGAITLVQQLIVAIVWIVIVGVIVGLPLGLIAWIVRKIWISKRK